MAEPAPQHPPDLQLSLVAAEVSRAGGPTRDELIVELHAARSQIEGLEALITAQQDRILALEQSIRERSS